MARKSVMRYLELRALVQEIIEGLEMYIGLYDRREIILNLKKREEIIEVGEIIENHLAKVTTKLMSTIKVLDDLQVALVKYWDKPDVLAKCVWEPEEVTRKRNLNKKVKRIMNDMKYIDI